MDRVAGWRRYKGLVQVNKPTPSRCILFREQFFGRHVDKPGIGNPSVPVGKRELQGFGNDVHVICRVMAHCLEVKALEDVQSHQHHDAL